MYLFLDTETTGFPSDEVGPLDPTQARICQIGAILQDANQRVVGEINFLIAREGWSIPDRLVEIHGITNDMCDRFGVPLRLAMTSFAYLAAQAQLVVIHNVPFDTRMLKMASAQLGLEKSPLDGKETFCTMEAMTPICQLPKSRGSGFKWPKLVEAYYHCFKQELDCAHDAMADVRGCKEVYWWYQRRAQFGQGEAASDVQITDSPLG